MIQLFTHWVKDWLGVNTVMRKTGESITPLTAFQQALSLLALIFSEQILSLLAGSENVTNSSLILVRLAILVALIIMAHYVVVAKQLLTITEENKNKNNLCYKYREGDRLTAKLLLPVALSVFLFVFFSQEKSCDLTAAISFPPDSARDSYYGITLDVEGEGVSRQYMFTSLQKIPLSLPQSQNRWSVTVNDIDGTNLGSFNFDECPTSKTRSTGDKVFLILQPR